MDELKAISPIDGRYYKQVEELSNYFSEYATIKYRVTIEIKWLIKLLQLDEIKENFKVNSDDINYFEILFVNFSLDDARRIKEIENETNHDMKSIEYFLTEKLNERGLSKIVPLLHFGVTSEDISNLAYGVMVNEFLNDVWYGKVDGLLEKIKRFALENNNVIMLGHTHGQVATPTSIGKEFAVFAYRIKNIINKMKMFNLTGKLNGAVGCYNSFVIAYPNIDWINVSREFVTSLGLEFNELTTQIESHDNLAIKLDLLRTFNNVILDFDSDMWLYISKDYLKLKVINKEVGSSVMPHKVNPINFENSMANVRISNEFVNAFANNIQISRLQRDLSDSSLLRNVGMCFAHAIVSISQTCKGIDRIDVNRELIEEELNKNPEVLAEAVQTVLRKNGKVDAYKMLKEMTRGEKVTIEDIKNFIRDIDINEDDKKRLLDLEPNTYSGLAITLTNIIK